MDLYKILGIRRNATERSIQNAYRKLAFEYHPDRGGDEERFKQIKLAYDVLINAERRALYDSNGTIDPRFADDNYVKAIAVISSAMDSVMQSVILQKSNLVTMIKSNIVQQRNAKEQHLKETEKAIAEVKQIAGRLNCENPVNHIKEIIDVRLVNMDNNVKVLKA